MSNITTYELTEEKNLIEANQNLFQLNIDENSQIFIKDFTDSDIQEFYIDKTLGLALVRTGSNSNIKIYNKTESPLRVGFLEIKAGSESTVNKWSLLLPVSDNPNTYLALNSGFNTTALLFWGRNN